MPLSSAQKATIRTALYAWRFPRDILYCSWTLGRWSPTWRLFGVPLIQKHPKASIRIGQHWSACSRPRYNSLGVFQKVTIKVQRPGAALLIEDNVGMSGISISCSRYIRIGKGTLLGSGVVITDHDAHAVHPDFRHSREHIGAAPVNIGENVFIGARSIILKGVTIGDGAVIGAGSVVAKNIPADAIAAGNPAKVVGNARDPKYLNRE